MWWLLWSTGALAAPLDPGAFTSLGASLTCTSTITVDTDTQELTVDGATTYTGVVSGGVAVFTFDDIDLPASCTVSALAGRSLPLALLSKGDLSVAGTIEASASGDLGGAGGHGVASGPGAGSSVLDFGWFCGGGGHGGNGGGTVATRGLAYGDLLTELTGGSGGGVANMPGFGGGGGAVELGAAGQLSILSTAVVVANGGNANPANTGNSCVGGGGGGGIVVHGTSGAVEGVLRARGGNGDNTTQERAGGGGRIAVIGLTTTLATLDVTRGTYTVGGYKGSDGVVVLDADGDGSPASEDCDDEDPTVYPGAPDTCDGVDTDCDGLDNGTPDSDGDGSCDSSDLCPGHDDLVDTDGDTVPDGCDLCEGYDDLVDSDGDTVPDDCDLCDGHDATGDDDGDGICDDLDDSDGDGVVDEDDICDGYDPLGDGDSDGVCDRVCTDWWDFDDKDLGLNRVPGASDLVAGASVVSDPSGVTGACALLDGVDHLTYAAGTFPPEVPTGSGVSFSIDAWVRPDAAATDDLGVVGWGSTTGGGGVRTGLLVETGNQVAFHWAGSPFRVALKDPILTDGEWHHLAAVWDHAGATRWLYVDGVAVGSKSGGGMNPSAVEFRLGAFTDRTFEGALDDVRLHPSALGADEVASMALGAGGCDLCFGDDATGDADLDGLCDSDDLCFGDDLTGDDDGDGLCDDVDDSDGDGVVDEDDVCPFGDDALDDDGDGVPDDCDACPGADDAVGDLDGDGVCDSTSLCVDWWDFDDPADLGRNRVVGAATLVAGASVVSDPAGHTERAAVFDGLGDHLTAGTFPSEVPVAADNFSVEAWVSTTNTTDSMGIVGWGSEGSGTGVRTGLGIDPGNQVTFNWANSAFKVTVAGITDGGWHHVVGTWDGTTTTRTLYVDGVPVGTKGNGGMNATAANFRVGAFTPDKLLDGAVDDVRIYDVVLTDEEVARAYTGRPPCDRCDGDDASGDDDLDGLCDDVDPDDDDDGLVDGDDLVIDPDLLFDTSDVGWTTGGVGSPSVVFHEQSGLYVMAFETQVDTDTDCPVGVWALGLATSPDGRTWTDAGGPLVYPPHTSTPGTFYWDCVAAHPTLVDRGTGDLVLFFKSEQSDAACTGPEPDWGCDPFTGLGRVYVQYDGDTNTFLATAPDPEPVLAIGQDYGYPHALYDAGEYKVMLGRLPDVLTATGTAGQLTLTGGGFAHDTAPWTDDEAYSPAPVCGSAASASDPGYTAFVGGRALDETTIVDAELGRIRSTDFDTWTVDEGPVLSTLLGDTELRHFDALRVGADGFLLYFSDKALDGTNRVRAAHTSDVWPTDAVESKTCVR